MIKRKNKQHTQDNPDHSYESEYGSVEYPQNKVTQFECGHLLEFNSTPGGEYINIEHGISGARITLHANGAIDIVSSKDRNETIAENNNIHIIGNYNLDVDGDYVLNVRGDMYENIHGNRLTSVGGNQSDNRGGSWETFSAQQTRIHSQTSADLSGQVGAAVNGGGSAGIYSGGETDVYGQAGTNIVSQGNVSIEAANSFFSNTFYSDHNSYEFKMHANTAFVRHEEAKYLIEAGHFGGQNLESYANTFHHNPSDSFVETTFNKLWTETRVENNYGQESVEYEERAWPRPAVTPFHGDEAFELATPQGRLKPYSFPHSPGVESYAAAVQSYGPQQLSEYAASSGSSAPYGPKPASMPEPTSQPKPQSDPAEFDSFVKFAVSQGINPTLAQNLTNLGGDHYRGVHKNQFAPKDLWPNIIPVALLLQNVVAPNFGISPEKIQVNSAYRSESYNSAIGGKPKSQHKVFKAIDFVLPGIHPHKVFDFCCRSKLFGYSGKYNDFTHIDTGPNRGKCWD